MPFYLCRMPDSDILELGVQYKNKEVQQYTDISHINGRGFVISPFSYPETDVKYLDISYFIENEFHITIDMTIPDALHDASIKINEIAYFSDKGCYKPVLSDNYVMSDIEYKLICGEYISNARKGNIEKAILSRTLYKEDLKVSNAAAIYMNLMKQNASAMVSLVYIPGQMCWVTSTPKLLVRQRNNEISTRSLAGTRKISENVNDSLNSWNEKDIKEQKIVSLFIEERFNTLGFSTYEKGETGTKRAGCVEHISTEYKISCNDSYNMFDKLLNSLNPTPAVCGFPHKKALDLICMTEKHNRQYYSGYVGCINSDRDISLYVNLRCASLGDNGGYIFVGGGITAESDPDKEWEETELKSSTIIKAMCDV